jgi:hypothetical protein
MKKQPLKATRRRVDAGPQIATKQSLLLANFLAERQRLVIRDLITNSEERAFFRNKLNELAALIENMPGPGGQDGVPDPTVYLHYFLAGSDWYILEKDSSAEQHQAFGWAILNGDMQNAAIGYISIAELLDFKNLELDLHWSPKPLSEVKRSRGV